MLNSSTGITSLLKEGFDELRYTLGTDGSTAMKAAAPDTSKEKDDGEHPPSVSSNPFVVDQRLQAYEQKWKEKRMPNNGI